MDKVYIVSVHQVDYCEEIEFSTKVFSCREKAKAHFKSIVENERIRAHKNCWEIGIDEDDCFCAFDDDRYAEKHSFVELREMEVLQLKNYEKHSGLFSVVSGEVESGTIYPPFCDDVDVFD